MKTLQKIMNFSSGMVNEKLLERQDSDILATGCSLLKNLMCSPFGSVYTRNGMKKLAEVTTEITGDAYRLVPFIFSNTQVYLFLFTNELLRIFFNDQLISSLNIDYTSSQIAVLKYAQEENMIVFTHPDVPPKMIVRKETSGQITFEYNDFVIKEIPRYSFDKVVIPNETVASFKFTLGDKAEGHISITVNEPAGFQFQETDIGGYIDSPVDQGAGRARITSITTGSNTASAETIITASAETIIPFYEASKQYSGTLERNYEPSWSAARGWPVSCAFFNQRLWFGGSKSRPASIWASRVGQYDNFENTANYENDAIDITIASNTVDSISDLFVNRGIQIFTDGGEWVIPEGAVSAQNIYIQKQTPNGIYKNIMPVNINGATIFIERNGVALMNFLYTNEQSAFSTESMSAVFGDFKNPVAMAADINPGADSGNIIYIVQAGGKMICADFLPTRNTSAFSIFETRGKYKDALSVASETYFIVEDSGRFFLEKETKGMRSDLTEAINLTTPDQTFTMSDHYDMDRLTLYTDQKELKRGTPEAPADYLVDGHTVTMTLPPDGFAPATLYYGYPFDFEMQSTKISIEQYSENVFKRIARAVITCNNTRRLYFCDLKRESAAPDDISSPPKNIYEYWGVTNPAKDLRYSFEGNSIYPVEILSAVMNITYGGA
ncbi:putative tail tubular protein B [Candidatus Termititenax aidoneus]|uniref:Tail tubular protein B n=1 Tax=Termititenax aidoneus TaxID=2218524 RepID=A0A388T983_TERA1|nr:putative tail tubular protein B [Candidatus Termititenax aidoneus]